MNEKERLLAAIADLHSYLVHHPDQERCPVCPRWDELQGAAMQAVTAIDAHEAELAALRAGSESAHAAQRHAETELSQYMAWYAMAEHQHLHEQRRAEKAEAEVARLRAELECGHPASLMVHSAETGTPLYCELCDIRSQRNDAVEMEAHYRERAEKAEAERDSLRAAAMLAYGYLWSVQIEPGTPGLPPHKAVPAARIALRDALDNDERKAGIEQVRAALDKAEAERDVALVAVKAMHKLLDRDCAIVDRDITLRCESHDQAWNYLHEMRDLVRAALGER